MEDRYLHNGHRVKVTPSSDSSVRKEEYKFDRADPTVSPSQLNKINFPTQLTRIDEEKRGAKIKGEKERNEKKKCKNHWGVKRMKYGYQYGGGGESFLP